MKTTAREILKDDEMHRIAHSCEPVFRQYGLKKATVDDLCRAAGVSRRTLYNYFDDKDTVAATVISLIMREASAHLREVFQADGPFEAKLAEAAEFKRQLMRRLGPIFGREIQEADGPLRAVMEAGRDDGLKMIEKFLLTAQKRGEIRKDLTLEDLRYMITVVERMKNDPELQRLHPDMEDRGAFIMSFFMNGLRGARGLS